MKNTTLLVVLILLCSGAGFAQAAEFPTGEISGAYSFARLDQSSNWTGVGARNAFQGFTAGSVANLNRWVGVEGNLGWYSVGDSLDLATLAVPGVTGSAAVTERRLMFLAGPRFTFRYDRVEPFVHGLFGFDRTSLSGSFTVTELGITQSFGCSDIAAGGVDVCGTDTGFATALGGGVQFAATKRLALITGVDYLMTRHGLPSGLADLTGFTDKATQHNLRFSVGLSYRFGFRQR